LALELPMNPNKNLTASNKIFEYLRCGLAIIATNTKGQAEIMSQCPAAGWVVAPGDVLALRSAIQHCLDNPDEIRCAKASAYQAGQTIWAWEPFGERLGQVLLRLAEHS
jgi:glycosyltransferase involved in cell wall biosynthesis